MKRGVKTNAFVTLSKVRDTSRRATANFRNLAIRLAFFSLKQHFTAAHHARADAALSGATSVALFSERVDASYCHWA